MQLENELVSIRLEIYIHTITACSTKHVSFWDTKARVTLILISQSYRAWKGYTHNYKFLYFKTILSQCFSLYDIGDLVSQQITTVMVF